MHPPRTDAAWSLVRLRGGRFRLTVTNTSALGKIDRFRWIPPTNLTVTSVESSNAGHCALDSEGEIICSGNLVPPRCLCTNSGGYLTVDFTGHVAQPKANGRYRVNASLGAGVVAVTAMTPVPYLIPSTPQEARNRRGF